MIRERGFRIMGPGKFEVSLGVNVHCEVEKNLPRIYTTLEDQLRKAVPFFHWQGKIERMLCLNWRRSGAPKVSMLIETVNINSERAASLLRQSGFECLPQMHLTLILIDKEKLLAILGEML
ncbi:MAG TPA: hypothetical protein VF817_00910 [Patescibacteria group bacterium]